MRKKIHIFAASLNQQAADLNAAVTDNYLPFAWWQHRKRLHGYSYDRGHLYRGHLYFLNIRDMDTKNEEQPWRLAEVLNTTEAQDNADGITISNGTRTLVKCMARLSDIHTDVVEVYSRLYEGAQTDKELAGFYGAYSALRNELLKLVSDYSADWMLNEDYR